MSSRRDLLVLKSRWLHPEHDNTEHADRCNLIGEGYLGEAYYLLLHRYDRSAVCISEQQDRRR